MTVTPTPHEELDRPDDPVRAGFAELGTGAAPFDMPRGPMGLWGALASVSAPSVGARELPLADTARFGSGGTPFDYDPLLAVDLDVALDGGVGGVAGPDPVAG